MCLQEQSNYDQLISELIKNLENNSEFSEIEIGDSSFNNTEIKWIKYKGKSDDKNMGKENLITIIPSRKGIIKIAGQIKENSNHSMCLINEINKNHKHK